MPDLADIASETIEACMADAERRARGKSAPEIQPGFDEWDGEHCLECEDEIPEARKRQQRVRCVMCQSLLERRKL